MIDLVPISGIGVERLLDNAEWRPITQYDKERRPSVLLRGVAPHQWTLGYWGVLVAPWLFDEYSPAALARDPKPFWRKAIDWDKGLPLSFDPMFFADIDSFEIEHLQQN